MKKIAIISMLFLMVIADMQLQAQETKNELKSEIKSDRKALRKLKGTEVNQKAKDHFSSDFENVQNVLWKREGTFDQVTFTQNGLKKTAFYYEDGNLVGTAQRKAFSDLPAKAQEEIKTKYKDFKVVSVIFYDDNEADDTDMILFEVQFEHADNYFVEAIKADKTIVLKVSMTGDVSFFKDI